MYPKVTLEFFVYSKVKMHIFMPLRLYSKDKIMYLKCENIFKKA